LALQGFNYKIKWSKDFTTRSNPPAGKEDLVAFTVATANSVGNPQAHKKDDGKYYIKPSTLTVQIKMNKSQSWVLSDSKTEKLLKHEQMHYNISALGGRDLERGLLALSANSVEELLRKRDELNAKIQKLIDKTNDEYDNKILWGTDHGRTGLHQEFWEMHLAKLMNDPKGELKSIYHIMQR
jgi:hypothetical protein